MWSCPKCKQRFVNANQWHSCCLSTVENFLDGKTKKAIELYDHLISEFKKFGNFELHPAKTRIALNRKMRFASINRLGKDFVDAHLVFNKKFGAALCFRKIDEVSKTDFVHHFRIYDKEDVTEELKLYMKMAYEIGARKHLEKKKMKKDE